MVIKKLLGVILGLFLIGMVSAVPTGLNIISPGEGIDYNDNVTEIDWSFVGSLNLTTDECWYQLNGGDWESFDCGTDVDSINSIEGDNQWKIKINDSTSMVEKTVNFWVDSIEPDLSFISPTLYTNEDFFEVEWIIEETNKHDYGLNQFSKIWIWQPFGDSYPNLLDATVGYVKIENEYYKHTSLEDLTQEGIYHYMVRIADEYPDKTIIREKDFEGTIIRDVTNPEITISTPLDGSLHNNDVSIETSATDNLSGVDTIEIEVDGLVVETCSVDTCDYSWNTSLETDDFHEINATATDKAGNTHTDSIIVETDNTAPAITLIGNNPQTIEVGIAYAELGATADDARDGNRTANISIDSTTVNTNILGSYIVTYTVSDIIGNTATETRTVNVVDTEAPVITLLRDNPQTIQYGDAYVEQGATADDNYDGDISGSIVIDSSAVNVNILGNYIVYYDVTDSSGNPAVTETRTVNVIDTTAPVITLLGDNPQTIEVGSSYVEQGATADDNYDGNLTVNISVDSTAVNTALVGSYNVTYDVSDSFGIPAIQVTRTVDVVDTEVPVITLIGSDVQLERETGVYVEEGATASDTYDGNLTLSIVINNTEIDVNNIGNYTVYYDVTDSSGNPAITVTRNVEVLDTIPPAITITSPDNKTYDTNLIKLDVNASEAINLWEYSLNNASRLSFNVNDTLTLSNDDYSITIYATDLASNEANETVYFSVNYQPPITPSSGGGGGGGSNCKTIWECSKWDKWSVCEDNIQFRDCLLYTRKVCGEGLTKSELDAGQNQSCSLTTYIKQPAEEPEEETEDQSGFITRITGGVVGFAKTGAGILTILIVLGLSGLGIVTHFKRKSLSRHHHNH